MKLRSLAWAAGAAVLCALLAIPAADVYYTSSRGEGCAKCHEIRPNLVSSRGSTHRNLNCTECHSSTTATNVRRVTTHFSGRIPEQIHLATDDVFRMVEKCRGCHRQEFAGWSSGAHSTTYARIFISPARNASPAHMASPAHNQKRLLTEDCLRCHGAHFEGSVTDLVHPIDTTGPWTLRQPAMADRPAIPCLACHAIHREGQTLTGNPARVAAKEEVIRPSVALFDRRSRTSIRVEALPLPVMYDGTRAVRMSPDARQGLCYQCHAATAPARAGAGDDRTPAGVHEGISCLGCHQKHSQNTRQSCAGCHPRFSNCRMDVERMDTTFADPASRHNIHSVRCADCHAGGVPKRRLLPEL